MTPEQLERIGRFFAAVLEWEPETTSPPTPLLKEERGAGKRKRRKVARGVGS